MGWVVPLLAPGGRLVALKGSTAAAEIDQAALALEQAGLTARVESDAGVTVIVATAKDFKGLPTR